MLLDELVTVIDTLKQRISDHRPTLRENETRTRMALIDPLLQVLGWDTSDPSLVTPEYDASGGKADYALLGQGGHPTAAIEAKRLGQPLQQHFTQMVTYANVAGIAYAGITDGDQWELYDVFQPSALKDKQLLNLKISASSSYQSALDLLLLWRPNLASDQPQQASKPTLLPFTVVDPVQPPPDPKKWVPLSQFSVSKATNCPKTIRFPDDSEHQINYWYDLVLQTVAWLWAKGILTANNMSAFSSGHRHLVHTKEVHPSGKRFHNAKRIAGTPLFLEANFSSPASIEKTKVLLEHFGQEQAYVEVESDSK